MKSQIEKNASLVSHCRLLKGSSSVPGRNVPGCGTDPAETIRACSDPGDDIFLKCAQAARAPYLVTGNVKDSSASWLDTRIVTPRRFLEILSEDAEGRR